MLHETKFKKTFTAKTIQGWLGKPKGDLQIIWKRVFIDTSDIDPYTRTGKDSVTGILIPDLSLYIKMAESDDFS